MNLAQRFFVLVAGITACSHGSTAPVVSAASPAGSARGGATAAAVSSSALPTASTVAAGQAPAPKMAQLTAEQLTAEPIALPGAVGPVSLDFLFYEPQKSRVWVPAGGTGSVAVFDTAKGDFTRIEGFKTAERETHGKKRTLGPSSGAIGDGFAYIGNRATQELCSVDLQTLKTVSCVKLEAAPDGVEYVPSTHELWVTAPSMQSLLIFEALPKGLLKRNALVKLDGEPECYALDEPRGLFLTNLEDKGTTLGIDLKTHATKNSWSAGCSADGPRGVAVDSARGLVLVACTDHIQAIDIAHDGALLGKLDTGAGLDNIDYVAPTGLVYAAAGKAARLTVARVGDRGEFTVVTTGETTAGARNAVADANGNVYVADSQGAHLLRFRVSQP
jgi:DNA-binding beta-propeller fold protein YncE